MNLINPEEIPHEIRMKAREIENWMNQHDYKDWELEGIKSRWCSHPVYRFKPCPFCGFVATLQNTVCDVSITCDRSSCRATIVVHKRGTKKTEQDWIDLAITKWNLRHKNQT